MLALKEALWRFVHDVRGTTAIEYGLISLLVVVGLLISLTAIGRTNSQNWGNTSNTAIEAMAAR